MNKNPFDNLPILSREESFEILSKPIEELNLPSDYYKAVFHLFKYPGSETEKVLLDLIKSNKNEQYILISKRKAIEILARHGCRKAIPEIINCLKSKDKYIVENAAWALQELGCHDAIAINLISSLLKDPDQNRRVLIQALGNLGGASELSLIRDFLDNKSSSPGIRGAAIAAIKKLSGNLEHIDLLQNFLGLPNQNDRQCAVNDIIDAGDINLLPIVLKTPVAPSFRMRAMNILWTDEFSKINKLELLFALDSLILDDPNDLVLNDEDQVNQNDNLLVNCLSNTDFRRAYIALKILLLKDPAYIWQILSPQLDQMKRDYGALYFLMILFRSIQGWKKNQLNLIKEITLSCLSSDWPDYMKFKPAAILTLAKLFPPIFLEYIPDLLNEKRTPFWATRYASLLSMELFLTGAESGFSFNMIQEIKEDSHRFVRKKARKLLD